MRSEPRRKDQEEKCRDSDRPPRAAEPGDEDEENGAEEERHQPDRAALDDEDRERVTHLSAILRLADAMDREHMQKVRDFSIEFRKGGLEITLEGKGDLELELWALSKKKQLFETTFDLELTAKREDS